MHIEELRKYALNFRACTEEMPFGNETLVFKVLNKIFLMVSLETSPLRFNFKALPDDGQRYREKYAAVTPGYHSNKKHWNSVYLDGSVPGPELKQWIDDSYQLVVDKLPKKQQKALKELS